MTSSRTALIASPDGFQAIMTFWKNRRWVVANRWNRHDPDDQFLQLLKKMRCSGPRRDLADDDQVHNDVWGKRVVFAVGHDA